jgi:branched-subunit amino acid transport protein
VKPDIYLYIFVMAFTTWCMRVIPSLIMNKPIQNRFVQSFLYYVPYVTLAVMTFPAIVQATDAPLAGAAALIVGVIAAWLGADLICVASSCCVTVFVLELLIGMM